MAEIVNVKRIKKDSTIDEDMVLLISSLLNNGKLLIFPIDGVYGLMMLYSKANLTRIRKVCCNNENPEYFFVTSSFSVIEKVASVNKVQYDFLHRVWPDELNVVLNGNEENNYNKRVEIRIPKYVFINDILNNINEPVIFIPINDKKGKKIFKKRSIVTLYNDLVDVIVYFNDWNRDHMDPTVIDIRGDELNLIKSGRVSMEEIQSLYFLDSPFEE